MPTLLERAKAPFTTNERLAERREIQQQIAKLKAVKQRRASVHEQLRNLEAREEKTVVAHQETCRPIQAELMAIEDTVTKAILADKEVPAKIVQRRGVAVQALAEANCRLEAEVDATKKLRRNLTEELRQFDGLDSQISELRGKLTTKRLANRVLLIERQVASERLHWSDKREQAASRELQEAQERYDSFKKRLVGSQYKEDDYHLKQESELKFDLDKWETELSAAQVERAQAAEQRAEITQRIVSE